MESEKRATPINSVRFPTYCLSWLINGESAADASIHRHVIASKLFTLDATQGPVRDAFVGGAIVHHADEKFLVVDENADALNGLATRPQPDLVQAVPDQVRSTDRYGVP
jgi:hypothetical protein